MTQWQTDGDERCLHAAEKLFAWSANMRRPDSSMNNDTNSSWNGITVFYANALGETLLWYGDKLPAADRDAWTARFAEMAEYLCQNIERIGGNVNYPITCAYTMALARAPFRWGAIRSQGKATGGLCRDTHYGGRSFVRRRSPYDSRNAQELPPGGSWL